MKLNFWAERRVCFSQRGPWAFFISVSVLWLHCKGPQTRRLNTMEMICLTALGAGGLKPKCRRECAFSETSRGGGPSSSLAASGGGRRSLALLGWQPPPVSASVPARRTACVRAYTWPFSSGTRHVGLGPSTLRHDLVLPHCVGNGPIPRYGHDLRYRGECLDMPF